LIFSIEWARSVTETNTRSQAIRDKITKLSVLIEKTEDEDIRAVPEAEIKKLQEERLERAVAVYGMITCARTANGYSSPRNWRDPGRGVKSGISTCSNQAPTVV
jgi:hypothetical protein